VSLSDSSQGSRQALVAYQKDILIRIPVQATNLSTIPLLLSEAKVSFDAVRELLDLASQLGISSQKGSKK
jgi:hypothetical protein